MSMVKRQLEQDQMLGSEDVQRVLVEGDLSTLGPVQRVAYYHRVCGSLGLNYLTKPFDYLRLNNKTVLYANRNCSEQLRFKHRISVEFTDKRVEEGCYIVTAVATMPNGRKDSSIGAVHIEGLKGEARANALMKCETKAKRRVTLSICGLSMLDETEIETIPDAVRVPADEITGEIIEAAPEEPDQPMHIQDQAKAAASIVTSIERMDMPEHMKNEYDICESKIRACVKSFEPETELKTAWSYVNKQRRCGNLSPDQCESLSKLKDLIKAEVFKNSDGNQFPDSWGGP